MNLRHRLTLWLLALPFSGALGAAAWVVLDISPAADVAIAVAIFVASELLLHRLASRIPAHVGPETLPGREAEVLSAFAEDHEGALVGYVRIDGERWRARLAGGAPPGQGEKVQVLRVEGVTLWVSRH